MSSSLPVIVAVALVLPRSAASARVAAGEVAHYSFHAPDCEVESIPDRVSPTPRPLLVDRQAGAACQFERVGVEMSVKSDATCASDYTTPSCLYQPLVSSAGGFASGLTAGVTIEAWLRRAPVPASWPALGAAQSRVVVGLTAESSDDDLSSCTSQTTDGHTPISFAILEDDAGCLSLQFKAPDASFGTPEQCVTLPPLPRTTECPTSHQLDAAATAPQHLVFTLADTPHQVGAKTCIRACIHACIHRCMHACMHACMHQVGANVSSRLAMCKTCIRACIHACRHRCIAA